MHHRMLKSLACSLVVMVLTVGMVACKSPVTSTDTPSSPNTPFKVLPAISSLSFVAIGDTGSGLKGQKDLAAQLWKEYQASPFPLVVMLGDNIYPDGNVKKYGETHFNQPYKPLLDSGVRFRPALGNHDTLLTYADDQLRFFNMPGRYYAFTQGPVDFIVLDTMAFNAKQQDWLEKTLSSSKAPWRVVYGHYPIESSGLHGTSNDLVKHLRPILERHHVDLYLAGHEHDYERFAPIEGVTYIISGGGGASLRKFGKVVAGSEVRYSTHHFVRFDLNGNVMTFKAIDSTGKIIDSGSLTH